MPRTRLAPSPTGALHLGNARTFLITWALARQGNWEILLRIEDLDGPRIKPAAADEAMTDLRWLGIDWDAGPVFQRMDLQPYQAALRRLARDGHVYRCDCTRQQVQAATLSAPHGEQHELRYPGTCRPALGARNQCAELTEADFARAWRLIVPEGPVSVDDRILGRCDFEIQNVTGDFLVWTKQGLPSYQLAVVVDDARQSIDQVIRGDDLLSSAARQQVLYDRLALGGFPTYTHLPLIIGPDGRRLAKRHGDSRISKFRLLGIHAERVVGMLARWSGLTDADELSADEFCRRFRLSALPRQQVTFSETDERWLTSK